MKRNSEANSKYKSGPIKAIPEDYEQIKYYDEDPDDSFNQVGDQISAPKNNKYQMNSKPQSHIESDSYSTSSSVYSNTGKPLSPNASGDFRDVPTKRIVLVAKSNKPKVKPRAQSASRSSSIKKITIRSTLEGGGGGGGSYNGSNGDRSFRHSSHINRKTSSNSFSNYSDLKDNNQADRYSFSPHLSDSYYSDYNNGERSNSSNSNNNKMNRKFYSAENTPRDNRVFSQPLPPPSQQIPIPNNNNNNNNTYKFSLNKSPTKLKFISYPLNTLYSIDIESTKYLQSQLLYEKEMRQLLWKDIQLLRNELDKLMNKKEKEKEKEEKSKDDELYDIYISLMEMKKLFNIRNEILMNDKNKLGGDSIKTLSAFEISAQIDSLLAINMRIYVFISLLFLIFFLNRILLENMRI